MKSETAPSFWRWYRRLPQNIRQEVRLAYRQWLINPNLPGLRFKQISAQNRIYSVRISDNYRVLGTREGEVIIWYFVGTHNDYLREIAKR